jgi:hypothetical protein
MGFMNAEHPENKCECGWWLNNQPPADFTDRVCPECYAWQRMRYRVLAKG